MFVISPTQEPYPLKESFEWGTFIIYIEFGEDQFPTRSVREYENGYLTRYDRVHWEDQFGTLSDFRFGEKWKEHWGEPNLIDGYEFEDKWKLAIHSEPYSLRNKSPKEPCLWIKHFESSKWRGQP